MATPTYSEALYQQFCDNPTSVPQEWQDYFRGLNDAITSFSKVTPDGTTPEKTAIKGGSETVGSASTAQNNVSRLIQGYRYHGHRRANINPLKSADDQKSRELSLAEFDLSEGQLNDVFATADVLPEKHAKLSDIRDALQKTYARSIGVELGNIANLEERRWLRERMESCHNQPQFPKEEQHRIYQGLMVAGNFEKYLHTKFIGVKRFSLEGGDSLIPMLDTMVNMAGHIGMTDIVFGMAHRGRLNVLANIMHKPLEDIFAGFLDSAKLDDDIESSAGDVKYHMGKSYDVTTSSGHKIHMSLLNNPSHLEIINPVVAGSARAKQNRISLNSDVDGKTKVLPLQIHGDTAFAGQGVVPETLNLMSLQGYDIGGTIHLVINNQVGFTANPEDAFSGNYCTDIAKMLEVPIFHVNGDDPEACVHVMQLAFDYRTKFKKDVVIDLVCYRRHGHNEGDDPAFTQPEMYNVIKKHPIPAELYKTALTKQTSLSAQEADAMTSDYAERMDIAYDKAKKGTLIKNDMFGGAWSNMQRNSSGKTKTDVTTTALKKVADGVTTYPKDFTPNKKVDKVLQQRAEMLRGKEKLNWGAAEAAAYGTLLQEGFSIRLSGQDVQRGTFSHRHVGVVDNANGHKAFPLGSLAQKDNYLSVWNSSLSELAVLGFEFGYSLAAPQTMTIWEAQFGDFSNGAQIVIDQFISSSESKWHRMSGLVMQLPHGAEGQGPEHSSARLERYLQLCAEDNMVVAYPTTPASMFHLLRRQMHRSFRKPLIIMTPKSLLRHPLAVSDISELTSGAFQKLIPADTPAKGVKRVVLTSGKFYYDIKAQQEESKSTSVAVIRLEQLYPLPIEDIKTELKKYKGAEIIWTQEEPKNQGAWTFILDNLTEELGQPIKYIGRVAGASPAVGSGSRHAREQSDIINQILNLKSAKKAS